MTEDETIYQMMTACVIAEGLKLLIEKLQSSAYIHDEGYKSLLAFISNLHWQNYKIQTAHKIEFDLFGRLHIKTENDNRMNCN